ncbi:hypothetical protein QW131_12615 [Roseibium salinum]|nr:hypothetical protein [Roseibium salinum]
MGSIPTLPLTRGRGPPPVGLFAAHPAALTVACALTRAPVFGGEARHVLAASALLELRRVLWGRFVSARRLVGLPLQHPLADKDVGGSEA